MQILYYNIIQVIWGFYPKEFVYLLHIYCPHPFNFRCNSDLILLEVSYYCSKNVLKLLLLNVLFNFLFFLAKPFIRIIITNQQICNAIYWIYYNFLEFIRNDFCSRIFVNLILAHIFVSLNWNIPFFFYTWLFCFFKIILFIAFSFFLLPKFFA